jgi:peptidoglycan/xylan/chitin deacetylase (PgdA/CDA1 family)
LKDLLAEPLVTVGNHTADHAILTICDDNEARNQIATCQKHLAELTSSAPEIIAYPNGNFDDRIIRIARAEGLRLGVVVEPRKNRLPLTERAQMTIGRYLVQGGNTLLDECQRSRSDVQLLSLRWRRF